MYVFGSIHVGIIPNMYTAGGNVPSQQKQAGNERGQAEAAEASAQRKQAALQPRPLALQTLLANDHHDTVVLYIV